MTDTTAIKVVTVKNPFRRADRDIKAVDYNGETVEVLCKRAVPADIDVTVSINGLVIERQFWTSTTLRPGDELVVIPKVQGGGGDDKNILGAVMMIAVAVAAPGLGNLMAGAAWGAEATLMSTIFTAAIMVGGGMLVNSLMPGPKGLEFSSGMDASPTYGWNPVTTQQQGIPVPKYYGKNKIYGNIISAYTSPKSGDDTEQEIYMILALGSGPVKGITQSDGTNDDIFINGQRSVNYEDVSTEEKLGNLNQAAISLFSYTRPEYRPARVVTNTGGSEIYTTPDNDYDDLEVEIMFDRGLFHANNAGGISNYSVDIKIEISEHDAGSWTTLVDDTITDNSTEPIVKTYTCSTGSSYTGGSNITINRGTKYDIRVSKDTADRSSSRYGDRLVLSAVREVLQDGFKYPGTSLLAVKALATDQLSGSLSVSVIQEGSYVRVYDDGTTTWSIEYSTNPAWILYDILTQPVISGDGGGTAFAVERYNGINPSRLDLSSFVTLADFCDETTNIDDGKGGTEKRITFNGGFDTGTTMWEAALEVCQVARCALVWDGVEIRVAIDKTTTATQVFGVSNIIKDSFKQTYLPTAERISEIEVHYLDAEQDYRRVPFSVFNSSAGNWENKLTLQLKGITKQSEAWRAAMFRLAQNVLLKSTVEFEADIDAIACTVGDVIYVQHDVPQWGYSSRVSSATSTVLNLKSQINIDDSDTDTWKIIVRDSADDTLEEKTLEDVFLTISPQTYALYIAGDYTDRFSVGDVVRVLETGGSRYQDMTVTNVSSAGLGGADTSVTVSGYNPAGGSSWMDNTDKVYNKTRFKVTSSLSFTPAEDNMVILGPSSVYNKKYRITGLKKSGEQRVTVLAIEYNASIYDYDTDTPNLPIVNYDAPVASEVAIGKQKAWADIRREYPKTTIGVPVMDVPITHNLAWSGNDSDTVSWSKADGTDPILLMYKGVTYEITADSTTDTYIYWDKNDSNNTFKTTGTLSNAIGADKWLMAVNDDGQEYEAFGVKVLHAGLIQASQLSAISANLGNITSGEIILDLTGGGTNKLRIDENGIYVSGDDGSTWTEFLYNDSGTLKVKADLVTAGTLVADVIDNDTLADITGAFSQDLDDYVTDRDGNTSSEYDEYTATRAGSDSDYQDYQNDDYANSTLKFECDTPFAYTVSPVRFSFSTSKLYVTTAGGDYKARHYIKDSDGNYLWTGTVQTGSISTGTWTTVVSSGTEDFDLTQYMGRTLKFGVEVLFARSGLGNSTLRITNELLKRTKIYTSILNKS